MGSCANQIIALMVGVVAIIALLIWGTAITETAFRDRLPPEAVCPAQWKCVGPPDTRDPNCKCWERY